MTTPSQDPVAVAALPALEVEPHAPSPPFLSIRHPGYNDGNNVLLTLLATDGTSDAPGLQYGFVHTACAIITNNSFHGRLTTSRQVSAADLAEPLVFGRLLPAGDYYFHLLSTHPTDVSTPPISLAASAPYAVVPNFAEWVFPHDILDLPPAWWGAPIAATMTPPIGPRARDVTCRLTAYDFPLESAHIVPASEKTWFGTNNMDRYAPASLKRGEAIVDAEENAILLRQDVHTLWDTMRLSLVPKSDGDHWTWVVHLNTWSPVQHHTFHNRSLQPLAGVRREYMLARFAWDIFPKLQPFLQRHVSRRVIIRQGAGVHEFVTDDLDPFCQNQGRLRSSRSPRKARESPSKRRRSTDGARELRSFDSGIGRWYSERQESLEAVNGDLSTGEDSAFEYPEIEAGEGFDEEDNWLRLRRDEIARSTGEHEAEVGGLHLKRRRASIELNDDEVGANRRGRKRWRVYKPSV